MWMHDSSWAVFGGSTMEKRDSWSNFWEVDFDVKECMDFMDEPCFFDF